jgi:hypothetical protein
MVRTPLAALAALLLAHAPALAQGTARSMDVDVSIRSAALGGASNALFWGQGTNHWGNPALLAYSTGIRFEHGHTDLVPGLATDVTFETDVMKLGVLGFGLVFSGTPFPKGVELQYESEGLDPGNPTGTFSSGETVDSWGFGVSPIRILETLLGYAKQPVRPTSKVDVTYGMNFKDVSLNLGPGVPTTSTSAMDWGILGRIKLVDLPIESTSIPLAVEIAYGYSMLSFDESEVTFINEDVTVPVSRHERQGAAVRMAFDHPGLHQSTDSRWAWFLAGLSPLVTLGVTSDHDNITAGDFGGYDVSGYGFELELVNIAAFRIGHYTDELGGIDDRTWGYAIGLPFGKAAGVRYEESWFPQAADAQLPHVDRRGFSVWVDPLQIRRGP